MSGLRVVVDVRDDTPPWRQIRDQLVHAVLTGALPVDARLPPIRQLARDLGLSAGTVARAYRELEDSGWVVTARARGTTVAAAHPDTSGELHAAAAAFAARATALGVGTEEAVRAVRAAFTRPPD